MEQLSLSNVIIPPTIRVITGEESIIWQKQDELFGSVSSNTEWPQAKIGYYDLYKEAQITDRNVSILFVDDKPVISVLYWRDVSNYVNGSFASYPSMSFSSSEVENLLSVIQEYFNLITKRYGYTKEAADVWVEKRQYELYLINDNTGQTDYSIETLEIKDEVVASVLCQHAGSEEDARCIWAGFAQYSFDLPTLDNIRFDPIKARG